ncbi:probable RNA polymerase II nuclear localization protein SLC7A6OS [Anopheles stephensi]|uniref:probable RNA polymerase II nuclear localization protein SLC7A6OS n=1 Tax=Anopheles stephensi TaxID=30069 RepID=UPI001658A2BC|nr:probable RNA polymerase II nuclear localization protein SLC7A6OS [Anopheles stephensi]XP_035914852.1 probable RNA polymerase II nuclear localization protein SLC7A6OS [Anopheles stephensi]
MATVIRLKRRVDEDPLNAFVLNCKRQRVEGDTGDEDSNANATDAAGAAAAGTSTILKFAGTFTKAEGIASHIQNIHKDQAKDALSRVHRPNITSRNRLATKQTAQNSRFKIVNCTRAIANVDSDPSSDTRPITTTIVDVEREVARLDSTSDALPHMPALASVAPDIVNSVTAAAAGSNLQQEHQQQHQQPEQLPYFNENGVHYVYDLYVADASQNVTHIPYYIDNLDDLSVMVCDDPLYASHRGLDSDDSSEVDSEDSNAEDNWRNDYPDEDEGESIGDEDMVRAVEDLDLDGERELSSDDDPVLYDDGAVEEDGEDGFVYPRHDDVLYTDEEEDSDSEAEGVNRDDVRRYGTAYARYKARILREEKRGHGADSSSSSSSTEENFDLYD